MEYALLYDNSRVIGAISAIAILSYSAFGGTR